MTPLTVVLIVALLAVLTVLGREVAVRLSGRSELSSQRFVLRAVTGGVLVLLLGGILAGLTILHLDSSAGRPVLFLCWWLGCGLLAIGLVLLAVMEMREVTKEVLRRESQLWRDVAQELAKRSRR